MVSTKPASNTDHTQLFCHTAPAMRGFFFCLCGSFDSVCALSPAPALCGRFREPAVFRLRPGRAPERTAPACATLLHVTFRHGHLFVLAKFVCPGFEFFLRQVQACSFVFFPGRDTFLTPRLPLFFTVDKSFQCLKHHGMSRLFAGVRQITYTTSYDKLILSPDCSLPVCGCT